MFARVGAVEILLLLLIPYIWNAICLMTIAGKTRTPDGWLAWIPILNIYLLCKVAGHSVLWTLGILFVPVLDIILFLWCLMDIARRRGRPEWYGILMIVPVVNLVIMGALAFSDRELAAATP